MVRSRIALYGVHRRSRFRPEARTNTNDALHIHYQVTKYFLSEFTSFFSLTGDLVSHPGRIGVECLDKTDLGEALRTKCGESVSRLHWPSHISFSKVRRGISSDLSASSFDSFCFLPTIAPILVTCHNLLEYCKRRLQQQHRRSGNGN